MKVPKDRTACHICGASPSFITCESCMETMCTDCDQIVWVERNGKEWAHLLCRECVHEKP